MHISHPFFGIDVDWFDHVFSVVQTLPKMGPVDAQLVMRDLYEGKYGIYNHIGKSKIRPLSSVACHPCEDFNTGSMLESSMTMYIEKRIKDHFGLTLLEYLQQPLDVVEMMNKLSDEYNQKRSKEVQHVEDSLKKIG